MKDNKYQRLITPPQGSFFLFGPRGTGKSTWLKSTYPDAHLINLLDERLYQSYLVNIGRFADTLNKFSTGELVIVDEIQRLPALLNEVHRFIEDRGLRFILSGSSARKLKQHGTNLLAGRAVRRDLFPFLPEELGQDFDLTRILTYGSIPVIWGQNSDSEVLEVYVQTYIKQEIQSEALVRNLPSFARFLQVAALFHGQVLNISSLARDAEVQRTTVHGYLEILDDTLMTFRLPAFKANLRVKEKAHPKLYWFDPGVVRAIKGQLGTLTIEEKGTLFEGFIAGVLRAYQSYRRLFDSWCYWAAEKNEVDFLLFKGKACVAIEVKSSDRYRSEDTKALDILAESKQFKGISLRRILVYTGRDEMRSESGVQILPITLFLAQLAEDKLWDSK